MSSGKTLKLAVIGRGLIGAAAARHLCKTGHDVVLVGPDEPACYATHDGVFGSHHDEGRIARILDPDPFWLALNRASVSRYAEIAAASGIAFYREVGALHTGPADSAEIGCLGDIAAGAGIAVDTLDADGLMARFAFLDPADDQVGCFEPRHAGYISPRRLVHAQTVAALRAGARVVAEPALGLSEHRTGVAIRTPSGTIEADRVLVAAGGHTQALLGQSLGFTVFGRTVALFRLEAPEAARLAGMPSMLCFGPRGDDPYILPPIRYPDGGTWLKIGGDPDDRVLAGETDIADWFRSGGSREVAAGLEVQLRRRIRDLDVAGRRVVPCMTTFRDSGLPAIGPVSDRVTVAFGGHGKGAKCSDELGRLGGLALLGEVRAALAP